MVLMKKPRILVVGSMNMDIMMYGVSRLPVFGESVTCDSYAYFTGGKGSNQAYACAMQGADSVLVGRVGRDANGRMLTDDLGRAGVCTDYVAYDSDAQTGMDPIIVDESGKYISFVVLGANARVSPQDVERALNAGCYDMMVMQLEIPLETVFRAYEMARKRDIRVFLDAGPAMPVPLERLRGLFILSPNEPETKALTGIQPDTPEQAIEAAKCLYERAAPKYVVLKLGQRGALLYDGVRHVMVPPFPVKAVDSTAAGDTFGAAMAVRLCKGEDIEGAIRFGNAAAGLCVSRKGALGSIPSEAETTAFLESCERLNGRD